MRLFPTEPHDYLTSPSPPFSKKKIKEKRENGKEREEEK